MPYSAAGLTVAERVQEARALHACCSSGALALDVQRTVRGHIYVSLFGMYERCLTDCVLTAIYLANTMAIPTADMKHGFKLLALLPQFQGYRDCSSDRTWTRGRGILDSSGSTIPGTLQPVVPKDGSFMRASQLELVWELFGLVGDPWPHPRLKGRIDEIVSARNLIAHGEQAASVCGAQLSNAEMLTRIDDFEALCVHMVAVFDSQLAAMSGFTK